MSQLLFSYLPPIVALVSVIFLIVRLRLFTGREHDGRPAIIFGGFFVIVASLWQPVRSMSDYATWFVSSAYPVIDLLQTIVLLSGLVLMIIGIILYADFWITLRESLKEREDRLSIIDNLQHDARQPYQLLELLTISLREILSNLTGCSGVVFLTNRGRRQFVLATASGLNKSETAGLEQYPYGGNIVTQAVELGEPLIGGLFEFSGRHSQLSESHFQSSLVLPLVSGMEKVGAILLLADRERVFSRTEIAYLAPVAEWLAEKVKSARLARELAILTRKSEEQKSSLQAHTDRLSNAARQISSSDDLTAFCRSLTGLLDCESVQMCLVSEGLVSIIAGSEPVDQVSENFSAALVDAIDKTKPLIINQESGDEQSGKVIQSTLVCPLPGKNRPAALLLTRSDRAFEVSDSDLLHLEPFVLLAHLSLQENESNKLALIRRAGIDRVLEILRPESMSVDNESSIQKFAEIISSGIPGENLALPLSAELKPLIRKIPFAQHFSEDLMELRISPGEGNIGRASVSRRCEFLHGRAIVADDLARYDSHNRALLAKYYEETGSSSFIAACPVFERDRFAGMVVLFARGIEPVNRAELERFLTLATGLCSLRITIDSLNTQTVSDSADRHYKLKVSDVSNRLNNILTGIIGKSELAAKTSRLPEELHRDLQDILHEAERAAEIVRGEISEKSFETTSEKKVSESKSPVPEDDQSNRIRNSVSEAIKALHISGNLYMIAGSPREVNLSLDEHNVADVPAASIRQLVISVLARLSGHSTNDEQLSIASYSHEDNVYIDICLHRKNFPPVEQLAKLVEYQDLENLIRRYPGDKIFESLSGQLAACSIDNSGNSPAYYSFRFLPARKIILPNIGSAPLPLRILAIDDQPVILDLIVAMGQSQGFLVDTALTGAAGLELAEKQSYDIVLTDLAMPGLSGLEVARSLRARDRLVPIILVTGWEASIPPEELESCGITNVLYKPFRIEQLSDVIQAAISQPK